MATGPLKAFKIFYELLPHRYSLCLGVLAKYISNQYQSTSLENLLQFIQETFLREGLRS